MRELEIPTTSLEQVRDLASWSGIEEAVDDDLLRGITAPVVAAELRRIADTSLATRGTVDVVDVLRGRADELDDFM